MKHTLIAFFLILSFLTPHVQAQTTVNANAELIQKLLAQIVILQTELQKLIAARGGNTTTTTTTTTNTTPCTFTRTLYLGTTGTDVTCLQTYLKKKGHFTGTATGYYGPQTKTAVYKWQQSVGIVPEPTAIGMFGPRSQETLVREMKVTTNTNTNTTPDTNLGTNTTDTPKTTTKKKRAGGGGGGGTQTTNTPVTTTPRTTTPRPTTVNDTTPPTLPTNLTAVANSSSQITLTWTASTDAGGIKGYNIYRVGTVAPLNTIPQTGTTFTHTGLTANTAYTYQIEAIDTAGNKSAKTASVSRTTPVASTIVDTTKPTTPGQPTASLVTQTTLRLTWTASTDAGGSNLTGYKVYRNNIQIGTPTTNTYNDTNLTANTAYSYTVVAYDGAGNTSATSSARSTTTLQAVVTPTPVTPATPVTTPISVQTVTPPPPIATGNAQSFKTQAQNIGEGMWGTIVADNIADNVNPEKDPIANPRFPGTATFAGSGFKGKWQAWNSGVFAPNLGSCGSVLYYGGGHNDYWGNDITALNLCGGKSGGPLWQRLNNPYGGAFTWPLPNGMYPDGTPSPQHNYDGLSYDPVNNAMTVLTSMTSGPASTQVQTLWYFDTVAKQWRGPYPHKGAYHGQSTYDSKRGLIWFQPEQASTVNANGELASFNVKTGALAYYGWPYTSGVGALDSMMGYDPVRDRLVLTSFRVSGTVAERDPANPTVGWKIIPQKNKPAKVWGQNTMAWSALRNAWIIWNSYEGGAVYELKFTGTASSPEYTWTTLTSGANTIVPISPTTAHTGPYEKFQIVSPSAGVEVLVGQLRLQDGIFAFRIPSPGTAIVPANDTTAPTVTASNATQNLSAGTKTATLSVSTNENATCKYGTTANTVYASLPTTFSTTGGTTHSVAVSGLTDGSTKTYVVRCIDGSGNANTSDLTLTVAVASVSASVPSNTVLASAGLSFTQKCTQAGVLKCHKFTDQASVNAVYQQSYAKKAALYDTNMAAAKLFIPSESAADTSGTFLFNHPVVQKGVSGNDQYWMQYRVYIPQDFLDYKFPETSWKVFVAYHAASCSGDEFTQTNGYLRGFPQYYETCGANSVNEVSPNGVVGQYDLQPGGDTACLYSTASVSNKPCFRYKGNTWTTYTVHLDLTARKAEVWAQNDGEALVKIIDWKLTTTEKVSSIYFGPYMTRKDATKVHPEFNMYYQNIIISKNPISMGGGSVSTVPSNVPLTSSQTKTTLQDLLNQLKDLQAELKKLK
jgi:hypothetical protein